MFFTDSHRIVADVETGQRRLVELLRDMSRVFLNVAHVSLTRIADPSTVLATSSRGAIRKADVQMAAILSEVDRPARRLYAYVGKSTVRVLALLPGCSIAGDMHLPDGLTDGIVGYVKMQDSFIHLTNAQIRFTRESLLPRSAETVIVNRASIELLCMADGPAPAPADQAAPAPHLDQPLG